MLEECGYVLRSTDIRVGPDLSYGLLVKGPCIAMEIKGRVDLLNSRFVTAREAPSMHVSHPRQVGLKRGCHSRPEGDNIFSGNGHWCVVPFGYR